MLDQTLSRLGPPEKEEEPSKVKSRAHPQLRPQFGVVERKCQFFLGLGIGCRFSPMAAVGQQLPAL